MARDKFMFFDNFKEIANKLNDETRLKFYDAITDYVFNEKEPEDIVISALLTAIKPSLDKEDGRKNNGGKHNPKGKNQFLKEKEIEQKQKQSEHLRSIPVNLGQFRSIPLETETETETGNKKQETETEDILISSDKSSEIKINSSDEPKYAFEGKIVKLNQKNFDEWKKAYPDLNLYAELLQRDRWLQKQPEEAHKNWFMSTSQYFIKQNALRKAQNSEIAEQYGQSKASNDDWSHF